ncbi:MAG TPA: serine/threonine-protein kinase, partial [Myxococcales bacterium]|nr:serine/threonine-protein kinase [Myxococcales bacterium]
MRAEPGLRRGLNVGRYLLLDRIGAGGAGVVYGAYDPELNRRLAIKLIHASGDEPRRILREAQAMARVTHPNVIAVHDVGTYEEWIFLAMELVDGWTLRRWLRIRPRSWREVLEAYEQAGRGLAAAHAASLTHRDFKPDNVMVGRDGRVAVGDFGLARFGEPPPAPGAPASPASGTQTTTALGTPGYMAPEQAAGQVPDARSDQYSYCVSLHEALSGALPEHGQPLSAPAWVGRVIARGLSPDPQRRFPSMDALLEALAADRVAARRRWTVAVGLASAAAAVALTLAVSSRMALCRGQEAKLEGAWDAATRAQVERRFAASGAPYAGASFEKAGAALDAYAAGWAAMREDACAATRIRGDQAEADLGLRMACLDQRLEELRAATGLLAAADAKGVEDAVRSVSALTPLKGCADLAALRAPVPPPADPAAREEVERVRRGLAEVKALRDGGKYAVALEKARQLSAAATRAGFRPLIAEALYHRGWLEERMGDFAAAEQTDYDGLVAADAGRADEQRLALETELVQLVGYQLRRFAEGRRWAALARATLERLGSSPEAEAQLLNNLGGIVYAEGHWQETIEYGQRVVALWERARGKESFQVAVALGNLSLAYRQNADYAGARTVGERALQLRVQTLGEAHPQAGLSHLALGGMYREMGDLAAARRHADRAVAILGAAVGPEHRFTLEAQQLAGEVMVDQGQVAEALERLRRNREVIARVRPGAVAA